MTSIGVKGNDLWLCNTPPGTPYQTVHKVSLVTGAATAFAVPCQAVTATEQGIFVLSRDVTQVFGLSEASGGRFLVSSPAPEYGGSGTIEAFDATTGAALGTVATFHGFLGAAGFWGLACAQ